MASTLCSCCWLQDILSIVMPFAAGAVMVIRARSKRTADDISASFGVRTFDGKRPKLQALYHLRTIRDPAVRDSLWLFQRDNPTHSNKGAHKKFLVATWDDMWSLYCELKDGQRDFYNQRYGGPSHHWDREPNRPAFFYWDFDHWIIENKESWHDEAWRTVVRKEKVREFQDAFIRMFAQVGIKVRREDFRMDDSSGIKQLKSSDYRKLNIVGEEKTRTHGYYVSMHGLIRNQHCVFETIQAMGGGGDSDEPWSFLRMHWDDLGLPYTCLRRHGDVDATVYGSGAFRMLGCAKANSNRISRPLDIEGNFVALTKKRFLEHSAHWNALWPEPGRDKNVFGVRLPQQYLQDQLDTCKDQRRAHIVLKQPSMSELEKRKLQRDNSKHLTEEAKKQQQLRGKQPFILFVGQDIQIFEEESERSERSERSGSGVPLTLRPQEGALFQLLQRCIVLRATQIEICGSFGLNLLQRMHEKELPYDLPFWDYGDIDIFCTRGDPGMPTIRFRDIVSDFESKLKEYGYVVRKKLVKRFTDTHTGVLNIDRLMLRPEFEDDVRLIDYTIHGIPYDISLINTVDSPNVDNVISQFDLTCCSVSVSMKWKSETKGIVRFGCSKWHQGQIQEGLEVSQDISAREDVLKGQLHVMVAEPSHHRMEKYGRRGIQNKLLGLVEGRIPSWEEIMLKRELGKENLETTKLIGGGVVHHAYRVQASGRLIDVEHHNMEPCNLVAANQDDNVFDEEVSAVVPVQTQALLALAGTEKDCGHQKIQHPRRNLATKAEVSSRLAAMKDCDMLATNNMSSTRWVHLSLSAGIGADRYALDSLLPNSGSAEIVTYLYEKYEPNRDLLRSRYQDREDCVVCDRGPCSLIEAGCADLLALLRHHADPNTHFLVTDRRSLHSFVACDPSRNREQWQRDKTNSFYNAPSVVALLSRERGPERIFYVAEGQSHLSAQKRHFLNRVWGVEPVLLDQRAWSCLHGKSLYWTNLDLSRSISPGRHPGSASTDQGRETSSQEEVAPLWFGDIVDEGWEPVKLTEFSGYNRGVRCISFSFVFFFSSFFFCRDSEIDCLF